MKQLLILIVFFTLSLNAVGQCHGVSDRYKITKEKWVGFSILAFSGAVDGIVEGYEFDGRTSFERKYGVDPYGFFGSQSWRGKKRFGQVWDFYHTADDVRKVGYISGGITITLGKRQKAKHYIFDFLISLAVSGAAKNLGMQWVRS